MTAAGPGDFRCFVAVEMPPEAKVFLDGWVKQARLAFPGYRFGSSENLHVTLQFLGNVERSKISYLTKVLSSSVLGMPAFRTGFGDAGSLNARGVPNILHVSIGQGRQDLIRLAEKVSVGLGSAGYRPDKPFVAHITLGRSRDRNAGKTSGDIAAQWRSGFSRYCEEAGTPVTWDAGGVLLMESVLGPLGPTYIRRGEAPLARASGEG